MSMTESEAIKIINGIEEVRGELPEDGEDVEIALMMAKDALSEVEQYRAIGKVEELQKMKADYAEAIIDWRQYKKIGTVERFRELTEKAEPKKPKSRDFYSGYKCGSCGTNIPYQNQKYCCDCGTAIDWE